MDAVQGVVTAARIASTADGIFTGRGAADVMVDPATGVSHGGGVAVAVLGPEGVLYQRCSGIAHVETGAVVDANTRFLLGSLTKQFTGLAVLALAARGGIRLDCPVRDYVPELPEYCNGVRLQHLVHHTSGIADYDQLFTAAGTLDGGPATIADILRLLSRQPGLLCTPGSQFVYSNSGFAILGLVVARATGRPYADVVASEVFEPLGMARTIALDGAVPLDGIAWRYRSCDGVASSVAFSRPSVAGVGNVASCLSDLARWDRFLYRDSLIVNGASVNAYRSPALRPDGKPHPYAYGLYHAMHDGQPVVFHSGESPLFNHGYIRLPDLGLSVLVLSTRRDNGGYYRAITLVAQLTGVNLLDVLDRIHPPAHRDAVVPPLQDDAAACAGRYHSADLAATWTVAVARGALVVKTASRTFTLKPSMRDVFTGNWNRWRVTFLRGRNGGVIGLRCDVSRGGEIAFVRC